MSDAAIAALSRQTGLMKELNVLANNIANASTAGFKREASVFTEYVTRDVTGPSMSMGAFRGHYAVLDEGAYVQTGGTFDFAIGGEGFFAVETDEGVFLTRGGQFQRNADGQLVTSEGFAVLDDGGGTIDIPPDAVDIKVSPDGTMSVDGLAMAQLGVFSSDPGTLDRMGDNLWKPRAAYEFVDNPIIRQGFVEQSNVNPVLEMARLVEAQRLFEAGQNILDADHQRKERMIRALGESR
ncbi:flagellar hook-basal body complex protein [Parvularcula sp. LCG005]|uniref:flagellar hook-basal body complex protein n=1 Tax=Parvularcula sp. LCG005 TaxID=3078805 RepID=UPI002942B3B1|nr:flagellar hook-basal body complex protein [Parvularcula sp. LCG005]WOI52958.1 flagellar hook-basal body complex protein [Parvularcula sp. LCG005]